MANKPSGVASDTLVTGNLATFTPRSCPNLDSVLETTFERFTLADTYLNIIGAQDEILSLVAYLKEQLPVKAYALAVAEIAKNCQDLSQCLITELQVIHNSKQLK